MGVRLAAALVALALASSSALAITLADPAHFTIARTFTPSLAKPFGALRFSSDGTLLYAVAAADSTSSAVRVMAVTRDGSGEVTGLGAPVTIFTGSNPDSEPAGIDAGLAFGPQGTLFYGYYPSAFLAERPFGIAGAQQAFQVPGVSSVSGMTFSPHRTDPMTSFGRLQITTGLSSNMYEVPLQESGGTPGYYVTPAGSSLTLFAKLYRPGPPRIGGQGPTALEYVPGGAYDGDLLWTSFVDREIWRVLIDDGTGLPTGGASTPTQELFASDFTTSPFGLAFDPSHPDSLFLTTWDDVNTSGNVIYQINGFASVFGTTTTTTTSTSTSTSSSSTSSSSSSSTAAPTTTEPPTTTSTTVDTTTSTTVDTTTSTTSDTTSTTPTTTSTTDTSTTAPDTTTTSSTVAESTTTSSTIATSTTTSSTIATTTTTTSTLTSTSTTSSTLVASTTTSSTTTSTAAPTTTTKPTTTSTSSTTTHTTTSHPTTSSSTSTSSSSSSTSTTSTSTTSSTSTTLPHVCDPADPSACDDGEPCTMDSCPDGTSCVNDPKIDLDSVLCTCERALPETCANDEAPPPVTKLTAKACTLFGQTPSASPKGQRRRLLRGANRLQKAIARVSRAVGTGKLSGPCAAAWVSDLIDARDRARQVAGTR